MTYARLAWTAEPEPATGLSSARVPPATGTERAWARIVRLRDLSHGWNGYAASAPSDRAIVAARAIVQYLPLGSLDFLSALPTTRGGVQIEWHAGGVDVEIEIKSDGRPECAVDAADGTLDAEGDLSANWLVVLEALRRVA
jgi:hypothetical protein